MFVPGSTLSVSLFGAFSIMMLVLIGLGLRKSNGFKLWFTVLLALCVIGSLQAFFGLGQRYPIPVLPMFFGTIFLLGVIFSFSTAGKEVSAHYSLPILIGFQAFRLPLELILHDWAKQGTIPETMTWTGSNWDIAAGVISLLGFWFVRKSNKVAWAINTLSFLLLINVIRVVVLSSPFPFAWKLKVPLQLAFHFPYVLIGPLFVLPALVVHLLVFRKLLHKNNAEPTKEPKA